MSTVSTEITTTEIDIQALLAPDSSSVMVAGENNRNFFTKKPLDLSVLDAPTKKVPESKTQEQLDAEAAAAAAATTAATDEPGNNVDPKTTTQTSSSGEKGDPKTVLDALLDNDEEDVSDSNVGRPTSLISVGKKLIEKGYLVPFDGEEDVTKYTEEDWLELFELNKNREQEENLSKVAVDFYNTLPPQLQQAYEYAASGGKDFTNLFRHLATSNQIKELDLSTEAGQEQIVRTYLRQKEYGTDEEIQDELIHLKDSNQLERKAKQFKPHLDELQEKITAAEIKRQKDLLDKRIERSQKMTEDVYNILKEGNLNGIPLDNSLQNMLFQGLTQPTYPSMQGTQTNLLGHLLEKLQFQEPNLSLVAEATWLLKDPDGYRKAVSKAATNSDRETTFRKLKTEQEAKSGSAATETSTNAEPNGLRRTKTNENFTRRKNDFFKRIN